MTGIIFINCKNRRFTACHINVSPCLSIILADRLRKLVAYGIVTAEPDPSDGRKLNYLLTEKGIDLAPVLTEMVLWAAEHEDTGNQALVRQMRENKEQFLAGVRKRWANRNSPRP